MKPQFRLEASGADITGAIGDRLLKLRINDDAGQKSDTLDIALDDRGYELDIPSAKATIKVWLGYEESELTKLGEYVIDEVELTENPAGLKIRAKAGDQSPTFKATKTRSWHGKTIGEIVRTIAGEHGFVPSIHSDYADRLIPHIDQENESDAHFLTRLAKTYGATSKPTHGFLIFIPEGEGLSAEGQAIPSVTVTKDEVLTLKATIKDRGNYSGVVTRYRDKVTNQEIEVTVEDRWQTIFGKGPVFRDKKIYGSEDMATQAGKAMLKQLQSGAVTIDLTIIGRADIYAERPITLSGLRKPIRGTWITKTVTHELSAKGFTTKIVCGNQTAKATTA